MQRICLIILVFLVLSVAGCGSDSDSSSTASLDTTTEAETPPKDETKSEEGAAASKPAKEKTPKKKPKPLPRVAVPDGPPPKKLVIEDLKTGEGPAAQRGDEVSVDYVGVVYKTEELFDANWESGEPLTFELGSQVVIKGWEQGIQGMKVGGERKLIVPPDLAYGEEGIFPSIPPRSTLVFLTKLAALK